MILIGAEVRRSRAGTSQDINGDGCDRVARANDGAARGRPAICLDQTNELLADRSVAAQEGVTVPARQSNRPLEDVEKRVGHQGIAVIGHGNQ